jgi:hypothetical protein
MNRDAIDEVGAFSWARIQRLYDADAVVHRQSSSLPTVVPPTCLLKPRSAPECQFKAIFEFQRLVLGCVCGCVCVGFSV